MKSFINKGRIISFDFFMQYAIVTYSHIDRDRYSQDTHRCLDLSFYLKIESQETHIITKDNFFCEITFFVLTENPQDRYLNN